MIYVAWLHLHSMPRMPRLRDINLSTAHGKHISLKWDPQNSLTEQKPNAEKALLNGFTSLVLQGISGHMISCICKSLNMRGDPFPPYTDISRWPLPLTHLKLTGSVLPWAMGSNEEGHIILPCLRTLELDTQESQLYIEAFFKALDAPSLQVLSFQSGTKVTWQGFEKALPGIAASCWDLHTLHLKVSGPFQFSELTESVPFNWRFNNLRELSLEAREDHQAVHFLHAWFDALNNAGGRGMWSRLEMLAINTPCNSPSDTFGASEVDHYVTLLVSLSLANCAGQPLDVWLNSKCIQFLVSHPLGRDVRCGFSVLHRHGLQVALDST